jgi:uncharacterized RDD family membrane protein YckC
LDYAGFGVRFGAKFVDGFIVGVPLLVLLFVSMGDFLTPGADRSRVGMLQVFWQLGFYAVGAAYNIFFLGKYGATPGKMLLKLRVVTPEGGKVSYGRATGRYFAELLSGMICYVGYIMAAFDDEKRTLHDRICNTRVVRISS